MYKKIAILLFILGISGFAYYSSNERTASSIVVTDTVTTEDTPVSNGADETSIISAGLAVADSDGSEIDYGSFDLEEGSSAFDLLLKAKEESEFTFEYDESDFGVFVTAVNEYKPDINTEFWKFLVNGEMAQVGVGDYVLLDGDQVRFELEEIK